MAITGNFTKSGNNETARWFDGQGNMIELTWNIKAQVSRVTAFMSDQIIADEIIVDDEPANYEFFELGNNLFAYYMQ